MHPQPSVTDEGLEAETAQIVMAEVWNASQLLKWGSTFLCWTCSSLQWFCLKKCQRSMPLDAYWTVAPPPEPFPKQFKHHLPCCWLLLSGAFRVFNESSILLWILLNSPPFLRTFLAHGGAEPNCKEFDTKRPSRNWVEPTSVLSGLLIRCWNCSSPETEGWSEEREA